MSSPTLVLFRKECSVALRTRATWCVFAAYAALVGLFFVFRLRSATGLPGLLPALFASPLVLATPVPAAFFTMGLFSRERASGTLETLLTAPVTDAEVVLGKFAAAWFLSLLAIATAALEFRAYLLLASPPPAFDPLLVGAGFAGAALASLLWTALGLLLSLLVRHESAAGAGTLVLGFPLATVAAEAVPAVPYDSALRLCSLVDLARGVADTRPIFACISVAAFCLFVAVRVLESRRWASSSSV